MEHKAKRHAGIHVKPEPEIPPEVKVMIEDDKQFWNYKEDMQRVNYPDGSILAHRCASYSIGYHGENLVASAKFKHHLLS